MSQEEASADRPDIGSRAAGEIGEMVVTRVHGVTEIMDGETLTLRDERRALHYAPSVTEGLVWALAGGRDSVDWVAEKVEEMQSALEKRVPMTARTAMDRLLDLGLVELSEPESLEYPIEVTGYSHLVSTRGGLYLVNRREYRRIASGMFFGICIDDEGDILTFDFPHHDSSLWRLAYRDAKKQPTHEGRILRLALSERGIEAPAPRIERVSNSCHYIARDDDAVYSVDCEEQQITRHTVNGDAVSIDLFAGAYHHINTLAFRDGLAYVVKSVQSNEDLRSSVAMLDRSWLPVGEVFPDAFRAHDLVFDPESTQASPSFWCCDSERGHLVHYPSGRRIRVRSRGEHGSITRGLWRGEDEWVVGSGLLKDIDRMEPEQTYGWVHWLDASTGRPLCELPLPETPCCIVSLPADQDAL